MRSSEKEWYIGIDFGTSNTCVIAYEAKQGKLYSGDLTEKISDGFSNISSCISLDVDPLNSNGQLYYVGEEVSKHPVLRPFKGLKAAAREITPNNGLFGKKAIEYPFNECGLDSMLEMGTIDNPLHVNVRALVVQFLKKVLHIDDIKWGLCKETVKKIVIGCPAIKKSNDTCCKESYEDTLKGLLAECFTGNRADIKFIGNTVGDGIITVVPEPELAGVTYLFSESNREDKKVLVIDIGGGTTDFSVLEYKSGKVEAASIGSCEIAGDAIDKLIFDLLPDGIPHSKGECRKWKEQLFAKILEGKITPFDTANLSRAITGQKITGEQFWIYYNEISNPLIKGIAIGKEIEVKVFDKIGKALQSALDDKAHGGKNPITGITTIFFVGGTSIITPLREKLVGIVADTSKSYCAVNFNRETDVVDMFGDKIRTLKADWDNPLTVSCYNAVAIGACIKAMGEELLRVKPKVYCKGFYDVYEKEMDTIDKDLIIVKDKEIPFAYVYYNSEQVSRFKVRRTLSLDTRIVQLKAVGGCLKKYRVSKQEIQKINSGLLIYAALTKSGIEYKACSFSGDPNTLSDREISTKIQVLVNIKMELVS